MYTGQPVARRPFAKPARLARFPIAVLLAALSFPAPGPALATGGPADSAATAPTPAELQRLGADVVPTFERVELTLDARKPDYSGSVRISLRVDRPTRTIRFHAEEMKLDTLALLGPKGSIPVTWETGARGLVTATAASELPRGAYTLAIGFANEFDTHAAGLYRVEAGGESYAFTQFEADDARKAFPCWDEPGFKIRWEVVLRVPEEHLAVGNTPEERVTRAKGWKTVAFRRTKPLPSYLVAIATGPLETVPIPGLSVPGRVVTPKGQSRLAATAVRMTPPLVAALERYFGRPYPFEKLDLIAVPEFWPGGMENAGAITFRDDALLLDPATASASDRTTLARYVAHEVAHMWFGDLVTMRWWDDLWLNESFAEWMGDKVADQVYPELGVGISTLPAREAALRTDATLGTRAIRQPVTALDNLLQSADELAYFKGQSVLGMFERWLGPETFRKGVIAYLDAHEWGSAEAADLWNALAKASGRDVGGALATWLDQGGVPLVHAALLPGGRLELSQKRFHEHGLELPDQTWRIPVALRYSDGHAVHDTSVLLDSARTVVALPPGAVVWVHPNADEMGYYRWSVEPAMLEALSAHASELSVRERVGLVHNTGGLLESGDVRGDDYLRLLQRFSGDPSPRVMSALTMAVSGIRGAFVTPELVPAFARYVRATLAPALDRIGMARRQGEEEAVSQARPDLLAALGDYGGDTRVLAYADSLARRYLSDPASVDGSVAATVLRLSATRGDAALFGEYRRRFETATTPTDRSRFLGALGWFREPALVDSALDYALTGPLRPNEMFDIPVGIGQSLRYEGKPWAWIQGNYDRFVAKIPQMYSIYLPYMAAGCDSLRLEQAKTFFADPAHRAPGTEHEMVKLGQIVGGCVELRGREGASVAKYLNEVIGAP